MTPFDKPFENTVGKGEISPFPTVFSTRLDNFLPFLSNLKLSSANSFSLEESKICLLVMGVNQNCDSSDVFSFIEQKTSWKNGKFLVISGSLELKD